MNKLLHENNEENSSCFSRESNLDIVHQSLETGTQTAQQRCHKIYSGFEEIHYL